MREEAEKQAAGGRFEITCLMVPLTTPTTPETANADGMDSGRDIVYWAFNGAWGYCVQTSHVTQIVMFTAT